MSSKSSIGTSSDSDRNADLSSKHFDTAGAFIQNLLTRQKDQDVFYSLFFDTYRPEACICNDGNAKYTLCRSSAPLDHDRGLAHDQRDDHFRRLVYASETNGEIRQLAFRCHEDMRVYLLRPEEQVSAKDVPAKFVPLGWLQKSVLQAGDVYSAKHTTNYVLLWNTSTKPHSLWVCYDYYKSDIHGEMFTSKLGQPTYYNSEEDFVWGPKRPAFPLEENIESSKYTTKVDSDDELPLPVTNTPGEDQARNPGFFNTNSPFDLAVLTPDINQWDADKGLDPASMHESLKHLRFRLGESLRARAWAARI